MKLNKTILATAAVVLPLTLGIGSALAYFTANDASAGGHPIEAGAPDTEIEETFGSWTKGVTIQNKGDVPVYVRVRAFSGSEYPLEYSFKDNTWRDGRDGYYYYNSILAKGDKTLELKIKIKNVPEGATATDKDAFNVIVVYERTPVQYDEKGDPMEPDWSYAVTQESGFDLGSDGEKVDVSKSDDAGITGEGGNE